MAAGQQHGWGDPGRVWNGVRVRADPTADRLVVQGMARDVAGRDNEREPQRGGAVVERQLAREGESHGDPFAGQDVADPHGEDARALLLGDRGALALAHGLVVVGAGAFAFAEHPFDDAVIGFHLERGQCRPVGQRKDVGGLQGFRVGVAEALAEVGAHRESGGREPNVERFEWEVAALRRERPEALVRGRLRWCCGRG